RTPTRPPWMCGRLRTRGRRGEAGRDDPGGSAPPAAPRQKWSLPHHIPIAPGRKKHQRREGQRNLENFYKAAENPSVQNSTGQPVQGAGHTRSSSESAVQTLTSMRQSSQLCASPRGAGCVQTRLRRGEENEPVQPVTRIPTEYVVQRGLYHIYAREYPGED